MRPTIRVLASLALVAVLLSATLPARAQEPDPQAIPPAAETTEWELTRDGSSVRNTGSLADLRAAMYDGNPGWLGSAAELTLSLPSDGTSLTLQLDAMITAGYRWELAADSLDFHLAAEPAFTTRSRGYGLPAVQTLVLQPNKNGTVTAHLLYRRAFGVAEAPRMQLRLTLPDAPSLLDLSDPTPAVLEEPTDSTVKSAPLPELQGLPASWDWHDQGIVPAVRDQGGCGSCWAFGTVGIMESAVKKAGGPMTDLSEQFLVSCNTNGWGCGGGLTAHSYHYNKLGVNQTKVGAVLEADKPYTATNGTCSVALNHPYVLSGWKFITGSEWEVPTVNQIKNAIYTYGPVTAGVCVGADWYGYTEGIFSGNDYCGGYTNHQIILTGWDDTTGTWILRNSWGDWWGEDGYMRIKWHTSADPHSRVGEGTSWVSYIQQTIRAFWPNTVIRDPTPTFKWSPVSGAGRYQFQVYTGSTLVYSRWPGTAACSESLCTRTPAFKLANDAYQWRVRARVDGAWKAWSAWKSFSVVPILFSSNFNGSSAGWARKAGGSWAVTDSVYYTEGKPSTWTSAQRKDAVYTNFDYSARLKRSGAENASNYLAVRMGSAVDWTNGKLWYPGYILGYANVGMYAIYRINSDGTRSTVQPWTETAAILPGDWNTLRVVANEGQFKFYINGTFLRTFTDSTFSNGAVGFLMYKDAPDSGKLEVNWARLYGLEAASGSAELVSPQQEALNLRALQAAERGTPELSPLD